MKAQYLVAASLLSCADLANAAPAVPDYRVTIEVTQDAGPPKAHTVTIHGLTAFDIGDLRDAEGQPCTVKVEPGAGSAAHPIHLQLHFICGDKPASSAGLAGQLGERMGLAYGDTEVRSDGSRHIKKGFGLRLTVQPAG